MWDMTSRSGDVRWPRRWTGLQPFRGRRTITLALAVLVVGIGCTSSGGRQQPAAGAAQPEGAVSEAKVRQPAEIQSLELTAGSVELEADRPLVWTSFRDAEGDLVIELPNSVPAASVRSLERDQGLIAGVEIELIDDASRPLTRLVVKTRQPSEHALVGEGERLRIQLSEVGAPGVVAEAPPAATPPVTLTYEPVEEDELAGSARPGTAAASRWLGTPEEPFVGPPPTGVAASQLFSIDVLSQGDPTVVRISGDGEFAYSTFRLENPERFVVDLTGVVNTAGSETLPVASDQVDQIRIGQFKPRPDPVSRVVFDLHRAAAPSIERTADGLTVTFTTPGTAPQVAAVEPETAPTAEEAPETEPPMVVAEAPEPAPETPTFEPVEPMPAETEPVAMEEPAEPEDAVAVAEVPPGDEEPVFEPPSPAPPSPAPEEAVVAEAAPPVEEPMVEEPMAEEPIESPAPMPVETGVVVAEAEPPPVPVYTPPAAPPVSPPAGPSDVALFEAQQVEVDVDPRLEEKEKFLASFGTLVINKQEKQYYGEPIDMSLRSADLVETLRSFATISDLNFVIQPGVGGTVTVELKGVPWDQAMEQILKINNLGMDIDGTIVRIAPVSQLRAEAEEQRRLRQVQESSVPLRTVLKSLSYSRAPEVAALLRNRTGSILSSRGTVQVDQRTNTLILRELPGTIDTVLAVIDNLDTPEPQVTIEARIIEATKSFSRSLGIQWGFNAVADNAHGNTTGLQFPNNITAEGGVGLLTGGATGFLNLTMGNILNTFTLDAQLIAAESEGLVNLVSAPRVTTLNNTAASIQSGVQIPVQTVSNRTVSVQYVNATLQLRVTPQITAEGTVLMDINVAKRSPAPGLAIVGATNSPIQTRQAQTKVIVRDGGTAVIGGIYEVSQNNTQDRLPGLANIPILGHLFKNRNRSDSNDELMIFITPRIVQM